MFYRGNIQRRKLLKPRSLKKKKTTLNQPEWDSTVQDLTVHAASPEELLRRQIRRKSKNVDAARRELMAKKKGIPIDMMLSPGQVELEMKKLAVLREVLYDHNDLNEVLKRTDRTMASVKDIFHDSASRKSGYPNITLAPGKKEPPVPVVADQPSKLDALSDSVMDNQAINDQCSSSDESEYEDDVQFESKVDYNRFMSLLKDSMNNPKNKADTPLDVPKTPENSRSIETQGALNCTEEVKRTLSRISSIKDHDDSIDEQAKKIDLVISGIAKDASKLKKKLNDSSANPLTSIRPMPNHTVCNMTYDDMQGAMEHVEKQLSDFEERTQRTRKGAKPSETTGLAGFTVTLIDAVTRLTTYVNEGEMKTKELEESVQDLREKLSQQVAVNEALAVELVNTQKVIKQDQEVLSSLKEQLRESKENEWSVLKERVERLSRSLNDLETKMVISEHTLTESNFPEEDKDENLEILETNLDLPNEGLLQCSNHDKAAGESALKSDMVRLLNALKSQNDKAASNQSAPLNPMLSENTQEAAKTIASVESHLRHLQLQHAEAQQRMDELTQQAQVYSSVSDSFSKQGVNSASLSTDSTSIVSLPVRFASLQPNYQYLNPPVQQTNIPEAALPPSQPLPYSSSPPCHDTPEVSKHHVLGDFTDFDLGSFKFLEQDISESESNLSIASSLPASHVSEQQQEVLDSIQKTQMSLEDRIAELNKQHSQAQERLQRLVARRKGGELPTKKVQISIPSAEMLQTPQISGKTVY